MLLSESNKILNQKEISEGKIILESKPTALIVHLTRQCILKCPMCTVKDKDWEISDKTLEEIISLLPYMSHVCWLGGEVFLYMHFLRLLNEAHKYDICQSIYTNGLLLDHNWMSELIKGNKIIILSIDSVAEQAYEKIRKGASYKDLLNKVDLINEYKNKSKFTLRTDMSVVIMRSNYREIEGFIEFAHKYNIERVELGPYYGDNKKENIFKYYDKEANKFLDERRAAFENKAKEYGVQLFNRLPYHNNVICDKDQREHFTEKLFCTLPWQYMYILSGGIVIPHGHCKKIIGNADHESILDIWNSPSMQTYRKKLLENDYNEWCGEDTHWTYLIS